MTTIQNLRTIEPGGQHPLCLKRLLGGTFHINLGQTLLLPFAREFLHLSLVHSNDFDVFPSELGFGAFVAVSGLGGEGWCAHVGAAESSLGHSVFAARDVGDVWEVGVRDEVAAVEGFCKC